MTVVKKHVCFLQHMNMCEKNGDHSISVNVDFFQSCFQIELDQNNNEACTSSQFFLCIDHNKKYKNVKPQLECCICDKSIYSQRFVGILDDKIDMLNIYINQILQIEKTVVKSTFCKTSVCLSCYKDFNIFLRSKKSDLAMARTDQFLENCFSQYEVIQTDVIVI
jgi:hypothetical protein